MAGLETAAIPNRSLYQSLAYNNPISQYVGTADLSAPIEKLQVQRDKADLASGFVKPLQSMPHDIDKAKASDKYYKDKIEEITNYSDPYAQYRAVRKLGQQYADDSISGERGHISKSLSNYNEIVKEATDKLDKGDIDEIGYWKMVHQPLNNFKGTIANNKGGYDVFNGNKVGKYSDIAKEASDFAQQWSSDKGYSATSDGRYINERTHEYVNPNEVKKAVYDHLKGNGKYREQLNNYKEYHIKGNSDGSRELHNMLLGIADPISKREGFDKYDGSMKDDAYGLAGYRHELENPNVRFSMNGIGINPGTRETTEEETINNVTKLSNDNKSLEEYLKTPNLSGQEVANTKAQIALNNSMSSRKQSMLNDARKSIINQLNTQEKNLYENYILAKNNNGDPKFLQLNNQNPLKRKIEAINEKLTKNSDEWLKNNSQNYTLQPKLITVDPSPNKPTVSKSIEELYNHGLGSWVVMDENGVITDPDKIPKNLSIKQVSETPIDELGYTFGGVEEVKDDKGNIESRKQYYIKPSNSDHNITEKIGLDLINENRNSSTKEGAARYQMGASMIQDKYLPQVSQVKTGETKPIISGDKEIGKVEKIQTPAGDKYKITADDNGKERSVILSNERQVANFFMEFNDVK